jgi:succinate dehydrogenase / fumarate reductase, membrane anchor subunit
MEHGSFRSPLARAIGLSSAKKGAQRWWAERVTAVALVPLTLWFIASIIAYADSDYVTFVGWLRMPLTTSLMILLLIGLFYHSALGLQVVIEDYLHSDAKFVAVIGVRLGCCGLAVAGIIGTLRIALNG